MLDQVIPSAELRGCLMLTLSRSLFRRRLAQGLIEFLQQTQVLLEEQVDIKVPELSNAELFRLIV